MGVPTFYRWLCNKYPKVVRDAVEMRVELDSASGDYVPVDLNAPNPNGIEFDNLYIDMNGVVHPCAHPEDGQLPETESEMFQNVCDYIDRIMAIARPRNFVYLCLDGVAPRAKMNQQRSRRYKAAYDAEKNECVWQTMAEEWRKQGREPPPKKVSWDSNVITPGTDFMDRLAFMLRFYVAQRMATSSYWRSLAVLVSDSNVPGEGEHKVMAYVREMRGLCDPNIVHCIHGMDADLIMLGLSTHEAHFYIMRETVTEKRGKPSNAAPSINPQLELNGRQHSGIKANAAFRSCWKPMQFLQLPVLREYLRAEFAFAPEVLVTQNPWNGQLVQVSSDLERHIDDFVFMCFFVGNDFLPHLPSLSLQKGSVDMMLILYKHVYPLLGDYLTTEDGFLNVDNVLKFTGYLAKAEPAIFQDELLRKQQDERRAAQNNLTRKRTLEQTTLPPTILEPPPSDVTGATWTKTSQPRSAAPQPDFAKAVQTKLDELSLEYAASQKAVQVRLGEGSFEKYRERYYMTKFGVPVHEVNAIAREVAHNYVKGLQWVLLYYRKGVPSWSWFFPHHYAPLASDIWKYGFEKLARHQAGDLRLSPFPLGQPVKPMEQLMSVLPPRSSSFLPKEFRNLMLSGKSPIVDFYPTKFQQDTDGKRFSWQWIALLPFIDINRLLLWTAKLEATLTESELRRNRTGSEYLFMAPEHPLHGHLVGTPAFTSPRLCGSAQRLTPSSPLYPLPVNQNNACEINEEGFVGFTVDCDIFSYQKPDKPHPQHACSAFFPGTNLPPPQLTAADLDTGSQPPPRGRGPFNINVATRIIMSVVGGHAYQAYLAKQNAERAQQEAARMNPASIVEIRNTKLLRTTQNWS